MDDSHSAVYGPTPDPVLRLVTCGGDFDRDRRSYYDNIIVFARLTDQQAAGPRRIAGRTEAVSASFRFNAVTEGLPTLGTPRLACFDGRQRTNEGKGQN